MPGNEETEAENCPFCGYEIGIVGIGITKFEEGFHPTYAIKCLNCNAHGPTTRSVDNAIAFWNNRRQGAIQGIIIKRLKEDEEKKQV